jgi:hypothetical protein
MKRRVIEVLRGIPSVSQHPSQFAPRPAWWIDGAEFAHFEGAFLELRLTREEISSRRPALKADPRVELRGGDWIRVRLTGEAETIADLALAAAEANRRSPGDRPKPTPDDQALARRRRFHGASTNDLD